MLALPMAGLKEKVMVEMLDLTLADTLYIQVVDM